MRLDLEEGSRTDRPTTILTVGALGSGKTMLAQKLPYEGCLQGSRIVDTDPKGDHRFHLLDEVAPHVETIPLHPDPSLAGLLDPLRVAPAHLRQEAAVSFLCDLLPARCDAAWITAIVEAVDAVVRLDKQPACGQVARVLFNGDATDLQVAKTLAVYESSGLTQLGFASTDRALPDVGGLPQRPLPAVGALSLLPRRSGHGLESDDIDQARGCAEVVRIARVQREVGCKRGGGDEEVERSHSSCLASRSGNGRIEAAVGAGHVGVNGQRLERRLGPLQPVLSPGALL